MDFLASCQKPRQIAVITASKSNIDFYMQGNGYQFLEPGIEA